MRVDVVMRNVGGVLLFIASFMLLSAGISCVNGFDSAFYPLLLSGLLTVLLGAFLDRGIINGYGAPRVYCQPWGRSPT